MLMSFTMMKNLDNFTKLLTYLIAIMSLPFARPCSPSPDVQVQTPTTHHNILMFNRAPLTHVLEGGAHQARRQLLYRRLLDDDSPSDPPCDSSECSLDPPPCDSSDCSLDPPPAPPPSELAPPSISDSPPPPPPSELAPPSISDSPPPPPPSEAPPSISDSPPPPPPSEAPPSISDSPPPPPPSEAPPSISDSPPPPPLSELTPVSTPPPPPPQRTVQPEAPARQADTPDASSTKKNVILAVSFVIVAVFCFAGLFGWFFLRRKKMHIMVREDNSPQPGSDAPISGTHASIGRSSGSDSSDTYHATHYFVRKLPKRYSYHTLVQATSNFNEKNKLGEGSFGPVYKGLLKNGNIEVAVKRVSSKAQRAPKQYRAEVKILTRLSHRNLVELHGWCEKDGEFLLVYKFMPNGSLKLQLYNESRLLTWDERCNIVFGLASALHYLHEECEGCILHRDIKTDNVLLDSSFHAKLSDFGLARLVDHDHGSKNTTWAGTMGYMAPEYIHDNRASKESDIYSFGVVLLEIACGRAPLAAQRDDHSEVVTNLIDAVWNHYGRNEILDMADRRLKSDYIAEQVECVMIVGLWCAHPVYTERPTIGQAIQVLKFDAPLPELPPRKPDLFADLGSLSQIRSSTRHSSGTGTGSSWYTKQTSHASSSTTG